MEVTVILNKCEDCRHKSHSGLLTHNGAKPVCDHPEAVKYVEIKNRGKWDWCNRVIPYKAESKNNMAGTVKETKKIPSWCPLKHGEKY